VLEPIVRATPADVTAEEDRDVTRMRITELQQAERHQCETVKQYRRNGTFDLMLNRRIARRSTSGLRTRPHGSIFYLRTDPESC